MRRRLLSIALMTVCGVGAWLSGDLVRHQAGLWARPAAGQPCALPGVAWGDCTAALDSGWSTIPIPWPTLHDGGMAWTTRFMPVAFIGLAYFVFMGCWIGLLGATAAGRPRAHLLAAGCAAPFSVLCVGLMVSGRAPVCPQCLAVHGLNALLTAGLYGAARQAGGDARLDGRIEWLSAVRVAAVAGLAIGALWIYRGERVALQQQIDKGLAYRAIVEELRGRDDTLWSAYAGNGAPVATAPVLTLFVDYRCPGCACALTSVQRQAEEAFAGRLAVDIKHFPLSTACNPEVAVDHHPGACDAAYAAEAARLQGGQPAFEHMHRQLLHHRGSTDRAQLARMAERAGLDGDRFLREFDGAAVRAVIDGHLADARALGVRATPAIFLGARAVPRLCRTPRFWEIAAERSMTRTAHAAPREDP